MVLQFSKLFHYKVSYEILRQDLQNSERFGKIQNVGETELSDEKTVSVSLEKNSIFKNLVSTLENSNIKNDF